MRGTITWRSKIMECLPFVMQLSLPLLGYALVRYLWDHSWSLRRLHRLHCFLSLLLSVNVRCNNPEDVSISNTSITRSSPHHSMSNL